MYDSQYVIVDEAFFGQARTGTINGIRYPAAIRQDIDSDLKALDLLDILEHTRLTAESQPHLYETLELLDNGEIIVVANALSLAQRPKKMLQALNKIREKYGFSRLVYFPGVADPYLVPVLVYAGVSFFDASYAIIEGRSGLRYGPLGKVRTGKDESSSNLNFLASIFDDLGSSIKNGSLRDLVEKVTLSSKSVEILRLMDSTFYDIQEASFPRRTGFILANSLQSLSRPDIRRYREFVSLSYEKPKSAEILLLIPCSAKKPYSESKTHRKLINSLGNLRKYVHEVIITSPVGLVPRDLEKVYPPAFYDIPVIGQWYGEEKEMINEMLRLYLSRNHYQHVIAFVPNDLEFIRDAIPSDALYLTWQKGNENEFQALKNHISDLISGQGKSKRDFLREEIISACVYSYGQWIEPYVSNCKIFNRYDRFILLEDGQTAMVFDPLSGRATISRRAAEWFLKNGRFLVEIDDFKPTSNIYPVGIKSVGEEIRPGDDVVVHFNGEFRGIGTAKMPRKAMLTLKRGVAVKMRN
ncbi:MAG: DUF5591 domain-containing protein [Thermoplasmataceae archaeon]